MEFDFNIGISLEETLNFMPYPALQNYAEQTNNNYLESCRQLAEKHISGHACEHEEHKVKRYKHLLEMMGRIMNQKEAEYEALELNSL